MVPGLDVVVGKRAGQSQEGLIACRSISIVRRDEN